MINEENTNPENQNEEQFEEGNDFPVDPGQEQHLPHEAWHVVQQKRRPRPIRSEEEGDNNDDE